jgi:hypothetical protein
MQVNLSISDLAVEFGMTRETVAKRLADGKVKPADKRRSHPVYRLRDALRALLTGPDGDPDKLDPFRRKAHFQAEQAQLKLQTDRGELITSGDVERTFAAALKPIRLCLETLPDILERDVGLSPTQVTRCERALDEIREQLHADVLKVARVQARK